MKKAIYWTCVLAATVVALVACKKNDDGGGSDPNATYAATPVQACNMPNNQGCNPGYYQQNAPQFINYQWSYSNGFCGCPMGYRPVMNPQWGISCAPNNFFPTSSYYGYGYSSVYYSNQNTQWTSIPLVPYSPANSGGYNAGNCYQQAASVCDTRVANSCTNGGYCRVTAGGSYMGICSNGVGNESYTNPSSCYRYTSYWGWMNVCAFGGGGYNNGYGGGSYYGGAYGGYGPQYSGAGGNMLPR